VRSVRSMELAEHRSVQGEEGVQAQNAERHCGALTSPRAASRRPRSALPSMNVVGRKSGLVLTSLTCTFHCWRS
jgi:hypothetical protein